jgi:hypothetical protein
MKDALTVISLPAGPTAYFRLTSIQMGQQIAVSSLPFSVGSQLKR